MVYSSDENKTKARPVLTVNRASKRIEVTRITFKNWLDKGLVVPFQEEKMKKGVARWFHEAYMDEIKAVLPERDPQRGETILTPQIEAKIAKITKAWQKRR